VFAAIPVIRLNPIPRYGVNTLKKILINTLLAALTLGLISGSALAHEPQYDNSKEPSDSPHTATPPKGGHSSLASAATNPIANLIQFQIQDAYTPSNNNASGSSNTFILQPVIPIKLSWEAVPLMVTRTTLPYINTPDFDGGIGTQEGFGDIAQQGFFIPKLETKGVMVAFGYNLIVPTGGDNEFVGSGKWSIGPGAAYINLQTPTWQWGLFGYSAFSFASQDTDRSHVSSISIQPLLIKHFDKGWYAGLPDVPFVHDFKTDNWTTAWGGRVGRVTKFGQQPVNLFGQATYNSVDKDDEVSPEWTYKVNMTFLFPG
jgi:hypothetical protein